MSKQHSRHTPSPSSPTPTSNQSKLPKFLQKPSSRDRSRSVNDGSVSSPELSASSSKHPRRSKFLGGAPDKSVPEEPTPETDETPVIVEPSTASTPVSIPRSRPRTDPPTSPSYASTSPSSRIGDLPTRLSGWFSHTFSSSTTDLSLPTLLSHSQSHPSNSTSTSSVSSPKPNRLTGASALLTAAKHGKGHLDKAMRYLLDSDATPDKCTDPIWLLGVQHPGYEPPPQVQQPPPSSFPQTGTLGRRGSVTGGTGSPSSSSFRSSSSSEHSHGHTRSKSRGGGGSSFLSQSQPASSSPSSSSFRNPSSSSATSSVSSSSATVQPSFYNSNISGSSTTSLTATAGGTKDPKHPGANWPPVFYADFTSKIWLTYRSHFTPIRDGRLGELQPPACEPIQPPPPPHTPGSPRSGKTGSSIKSHGHHHKYNDSYKSDSSSSHYSSNNRGGPSSPTSTSLSHTSASTGMTGSSTATTSTTSRRWNWGVPGLGGEKGWTSDSGWGCMLRTGQSLLANALLFMHLGRDWRRPPYPELTTSYATYVQIITWFLDTPDPAAPFSVHRMALAGKELGKDVGMWFGPSTAAGAIKTLVHAYPDAGMGVAVATDGVLYQTDVYAASHGSGGIGGYGKRGKGPTTWGHRPVLLLFGIRLGLEGVNPIYYDTIKLLYTFPQSVGIAGGRPSSSYYFVGSQADNLFYLDPHHARPAVPLRPPGSVPPGGPGTTNSDTPGKERDRDREKEEKKKKLKERKQHRSSSGGSWSSTQQQQPVPVPIPGTASPPVTSPTSPTRSSSGFHTPSSPSPLQQQYSSASGTSATSGSSRFSVSGSAGHSAGISAVERSGSVGSTSVSFSSSGQSYSQSPSRTDSPVSVSPAMSRNNTTSSNTTNMSDMDYSELIGADEVSASASASVVTDPLQVHYCTAYSAAELKTFHCERVRKMPMSGLDPSMLIGFLCRDEKEWVDLRRRVGELPKSILPILDEPPKWAADSDDNIGLESMSDDEDGLDMPEDEEEEELVEPSLEGDVEVEGQGEGDADDDSEKYYDSRSRSGSASESPSSAGASQEGGGKQRERQRGRERGKSEEVDTEEDPVDPITPGPANTRFEIPPMPKSGVKEEEEDKPFVEEDDDIEDDWVDPSVSSSPPPSTRSPSQSRSAVPDVVPMTKTKSNGSASGSIKKKKKKKEKQVPVPVPKVRTSSTHGVVKEKESFPFPVAAGGEDVPPEISHSYSSSSSSGALGDQEEVPPSSSSRISNWEGRMHTARARDGGRTQSGGVKGILTDDWVDSDRA